VSFVLFAGLLGGWVVATPLFGQPDEPAHYVKAVAAVRGQLVGEVDPERPDGPTLVTVPRGMRDAGMAAACYAFRPELTPACVEVRTDVRSEVSTVVATQAGRYPPAYYALVGLPTLGTPTLQTLYAARAVSALLCAALLATALTAAAVTGRRLLVVAVGVAASPMVLFLGSGVNPGSLEIAASVALWATGLAIVTTRGRPQPTLVAAAGLSGCLLVLARPISPFWAALIGLVLIAVAGRRLPELLRCRSVQVWSVLLVLAALAQVGWVLQAEALDLAGKGVRLSLDERIERSWELTGRRSLEYVGLFGWLDAPAPVLVVWLWSIAAALILLAGLWRAAPWRLAVLLLLVGAVLVVPLALEVPQVPEVGFYWQGRYTLPLVVGVPLLAAVLRRAAPGRSWVWTAFAVVVAGCLLVGHVSSFVATLARYTVGAGDGLGLLVTQWEPPLPVHLLVPAFVLAAVGYAAWLLWLPLSPGLSSGRLAPCVSSSPAVPASSDPTTSVSC
jgi:hypothetical protein